MQNPQDVQLAAKAMAAALPAAFRNTEHPPVGLILGTGLSGVADMLASAGGRVPFSSLPNFPPAGVESHAGAYIFGYAQGLPVIAQQGRCHLYEGRTPAQVCMGARVLGQLGIKTLIVTNAAGALNPLFEAGGLMLMADMINHTGVSPLAGENCGEWGERFPDMSEPFDRELRQLAAECALKAGIALPRGVYIGVHGPEMETPAETRMYRQWGADAIGMSTVLEIIAARHMGMKVMGISCLSNKNLPDCLEPAPIGEVIRMAGIAGKKLAILLNAIFAAIAKKRQAVA